jgi:MFS family permease
MLGSTSLHLDIVRLKGHVMAGTALPANYRRNFWALVFDFGFFGVGMAFVSQSTVVPSFLTMLGASSAFIGLMSSLQSAGWLLPQLIAARYMADKPRKKPYILWPAAVGRTLLLVMAVLIWSTQAQPTWLIMLITTLVVIGFWVGDGLASVPWFDLLSKVIPPRRRGRLTGVGQVFSGTLSFLAGGIVEWMLGKGGPSFPNNYAVLFLLGFAMMVASFIAIAMAIEEESVPARQVPTWREFAPQLWAVLKRDRVFRRFIVARQLSGLSGLAIPFYMTFAIQKLNLPAQVAGRYTSIGVVGSIMAAVVFGWANERFGSKRVIWISLGLNIATPAIALLVPRWFAGTPSLAWGYGLVFLGLSAARSSMLPGWMTYVLEWAEEAERPTYVGLTNTLNGVSTLFSVLGGVILQWTGHNYSVLFSLTIAGLVLAWPLLLGLPEPRHKEAVSEGG